LEDSEVERRQAVRKAKVLDKTYQEAAVGAAQYGLGAASVIACFKAADNMKVCDVFHGSEISGCGVKVGRSGGWEVALVCKGRVPSCVSHIFPVIICVCLLVFDSVIASIGGL
jgi:hypothetical protein